VLNAPRAPRTLRSRLTLWYTGALAAMLVLLGVTTFLLLDRGLRSNVDASLVSVARVVADSSRAPEHLGAPFDDVLDALLGPMLGRRFLQLLDPLGRPDPRLRSRRRPGLPLSEIALDNARRGAETFETVVFPGRPGAPVRLLTLPVSERGRVVQLVQVAMPLDDVESTRRWFLFVLLGLAPFALAAGAAGGWFLAGRALAPVDAMVDAARAVEAEDLSRRIAVPRTDDELGRLAGVLNDMLQRLEASFAAVRQFSADAAHELRTPLTILKGEMDVALRSTQEPAEYRRVLASCQEEVDRLAAVIEDLLFLARAEVGAASVALEPVILSQAIEDLTPALRALAGRAGVSLDVTVRAPVSVRGNAAMLVRVVFNLVDNAVTYAGRAGHVALSLHAAAGEAVLDVEDSGPGVQEGDRERIFERFYRADPARARGGSGLGLALVRSIVLVHGGHVSVDGPPRARSRFCVRLPLA
jgi:two-component system OmpR family sensor kinase